MSRLISWLKRFLYWFAEPVLGWITLLVIIAALAIAIRPGATEFQVRLIGLLLQWLGIGTVALGVRKTRQLFDLPGLSGLFRDWVSRFPRWRGRTIAITGTGSLNVAGGAVRMEIWTNPDPTADVSKQIEAIVKNVDRLRNRLNQMQDELEKGLRQHSEALRDEEATRARDDEHLRQRLHAAQTGGLHITFAGAIWLLVGVLLASLPQEIAALWP